MAKEYTEIECPLCRSTGLRKDWGRLKYNVYSCEEESCKMDIFRKEADFRSNTPQPEDGIIDIPHDPDAEAALFQETRERLSMLESHVADPETASYIEGINTALEYVMHSMVETDEYSCGKEWHFFDEEE